MFLKFWINFLVYLEGGGNYNKIGDGTMFYFGLYIFLEMCMHF